MSTHTRYYLSLCLTLPGAVAALDAVRLLPFRDGGPWLAAAGCAVYLLAAIAGIRSGWRALGSAAVVMIAGMTVAVLVGVTRGTESKVPSPIYLSLLAAPIAWRISRREPRTSTAVPVAPASVVTHPSVPAREEVA